MCISTNTKLVNVVEQALLERMQARKMFTSLDISNALKADRYPFRHREVAEAVRETFQSGAMNGHGYTRRQILVTTERGAKTTQAFVYYPDGDDPNDYTDRDQDALPRVSRSRARDLSDCVAAGSLPILPRPARSGRRDGALPIPRRFIEQLGWTVGSTLALHAEPGRLTIRPDSVLSDFVVRVWGGQRVRLSNTKLRLASLAADIATLKLDGDSLRIETEGDAA